jgi:dipeptidyl aminopeptidase/acylaminoacyl peptidase
VWEDGKIVTPPTEVYRAKAASPHAWLEDLAWNPAGTRFAFCAVFDGYPAEIFIGSSSSQTWSVAKVDRSKGRVPWEVIGYGRGLGASLKWETDRDLYGLTEKEGVVGMSVIDDRFLHGAPSLKAGMSVVGFDFGNDAKKIAMVIGGADHFPTVWDSWKSESPLFDPNPHTASWKTPSIQHITWKAPDGSTVGGVLELPPDYKKGDKLPLVVGIHGGPTTSTKADLNFDPHNGRMYFSVNGYAVLFPNYRGSTGYGDKFLTDLVGRENDIEVSDIIAGVQHLIKEGIADENRVGVMGWSNGGFLTNCLITRKELPFKLRAASSGAGIVDAISEWGFNDEPAYAKVLKKGHPWETPEIYHKSSPTYGLGNVKTPTLIHVGGNDVRCPPGHSRMLHRALKEYLNVPTELVEYPGEPHGLGKMTNRRAKMEWDLAWFEKYLKNAK